MTRYDRVIPPGGKGEVILTIDTTRVRGTFEKKAIVWSNDLERRSVALYLSGEVIPHVTLNPGGYLSLRGIKGKVPKEHLQIINNHEKPLVIDGIDSDLPEKVRWKLIKIKPGYLYRLVVEDISEDAGNYTGHLTVRTLIPEKPELRIIINGEITDRGKKR